MITKVRQFLERPLHEISPSAWRVKFVTLHLFYGLAWMFMLIRMVGAEESSSIFMLFVLLEHAGVGLTNGSLRSHLSSHPRSRSGLFYFAR
jgi:hypothetical protein